MKKLLLLLFLLPFSVHAISAKSYIAADLDNDIIYYSKNINQEKLIASTTKIMTAIVALECDDIKREVTVDEEVLKSVGSAIYISVGEKLTIEELLYGLLLRSGNDAALVIAQNVAGSMEKFAMLMNEMAMKIGMNNSYFYNASGLDETEEYNVSSAYDMALLTKYAMKNKTFRKIFGTKEYSLKTNLKSYKWVNKNKLLHSEDYITGGKTGFTKKARRTLVTTASRNNLNVVVVTLDDPNDFLDHKTLYENIYKTYESVLVLEKGNLNIKGDDQYKNDTLYINEDIYVSVKNKNKDQIKIEYELFKNNKYNDSDNVGYVNVFLNKKLIRKENIYVKVLKEKHLSWWEKFKRWLSW